MKYVPEGFKLWDTWFLYCNNTLHMFYLHQPKESSDKSEKLLTSLGHAVSKDGLHFEECESILPARQGNNPRDIYQKWTGCAVWENNKCYLYYTMRCNSGLDQAIGLAVSEDFVHFEVYKENPVIEPLNKPFVTYENTNWSGIVDCRDLILVKDNESEGWYGFFAVSADLGKLSPIGCIASVYTKNLVDFYDMKIAFIPRGNGICEVPDVFSYNNKWYMLCLTSAAYGSRGQFADEKVVHGTIYATADSIGELFKENEDNTFMGSSVPCGNSCRTVQIDNKRYVYYTEPNGGLNCLSLPKEIGLDKNGNLRPVYANILESLRINLLLGAEIKKDFHYKQQTAFAWQLLGGEFIPTKNGFFAQTTGSGYQYGLYDCSADNFEFCFTADFAGCVACGCVFFSQRKKYAVLFEGKNSRVLLTELYNFDVKSERSYCFVGKNKADIKVMVCDNCCDVYINDEFLMEAEIENLGNHQIGLVVDRGQTEFSDICLYELEK